MDLKNSQIFYDLGRLPLWNLADYGSCQYPRSRCIGERPEDGALELKVLSRKPLGRRYQLWNDSSWK